MQTVGIIVTEPAFGNAHIFPHRNPRTRFEMLGPDIFHHEIVAYSSIDHLTRGITVQTAAAMIVQITAFQSRVHVEVLDSAVPGIARFREKATAIDGLGVVRISPEIKLRIPRPGTDQFRVARQQDSPVELIPTGRDENGMALMQLDENI